MNLIATAALGLTVACAITAIIATIRTGVLMRRGTGLDGALAALNNQLYGLSFAVIGLLLAFVARALR